MSKNYKLLINFDKKSIIKKDNDMVVEEIKKKKEAYKPKKHKKRNGKSLI